MRRPGMGRQEAARHRSEDALEPSGRLEASGSFNAMFTHRVKLVDVADVNAELIGQLRRAYDEA